MATATLLGLTGMAAAATNPIPAAAAAPATGAGADAGLKAYYAQMERDQSEHPTLAIGAAAPDFALTGTDGKVHRLADYAKSPILVVAFISNHCPASQLYEGRIKALVAGYAGKGVKLIAIAPNGPNAVSPHELNYSDVDDSMESMKIRSSFRKFNFDYLYDGDTQAIAHKFGPKATPHIFIFDSQRKLRFEGRIDDRLQEAKAQTHEARDALDALLAGKPVAVAHTPVFGCSTKWMSHTAAAQQELKEWQAQPVTLQSASSAELQKLRANPTGKLLLVNFWATWCAPCEREYPALLQTYLWYRSRDFDFVSVSVDEPGQRATVQKFLGKAHSAIRNLQVDTDDVYKIMANFDKTWESGVPFSMLIAPDGRVVYQHAGEVDLLTLRRIILSRLPDAGPFAGNTQYWLAAAK
jgi:peroxiredoxin